MKGPVLSRRQVLRGGVGLGLAAAHGRLLERAFAPDPAGCATLSDVEHVVILIQENRSFDHYLGTLSGVRGFADPDVVRQRVEVSGGVEELPVFYQRGFEPAGGYAPGFSGPRPPGFLLPFHLRTRGQGECVLDITHDWGPQHRCWHSGAMDRFVETHLAVDGSPVGAATMGYYTREDLGFLYALADAFTVCDAYHCSVLGPTDPNRLYAMSGTLDPDGEAGGPLVESLTPPEDYFSFRWTTMPEVLTDAGVSWRVYGTDQASDGTNVLYYFARYRDDPVLAERAFGPTFEAFFADAAAGSLPQVSFLLAPVGFGGHPPEPVALDEFTTSSVLRALVANQAVWERTVLFVTYDENGGFFDHVPPPVAPEGTPGEYITASPSSVIGDLDGYVGPIGLGFRVPMFVVSPFSRGGLCCHEVFDHTSILRFLETRFGTEVPNLSAWRRAVTGDLTSALDLARPNASRQVPSVAVSAVANPAALAECARNGVGGEVGAGEPYPVPPNSFPSVEQGPPRRSPQGACARVERGGGPGVAQIRSKPGHTSAQGGPAGPAAGPRELPATGAGGVLERLGEAALLLGAGLVALSRWRGSAR